jgi:hypothetical protein
MKDGENRTFSPSVEYEDNASKNEPKPQSSNPPHQKPDEQDHDDEAQSATWVVAPGSAAGPGNRVPSGNTTGTISKISDMNPPNHLYRRPFGSLGPTRQANRAWASQREPSSVPAQRLAVTVFPGDGFSSLCSLACTEYLLIAARNGSLVPAGCTFPLKISPNGTKLP